MNHQDRRAVEWLFRVEGQPQGWQRAIPIPRGAVTHPKTRSYEAAIAMAARMWLPREPLEGPLGCEILAVLRLPQRRRGGAVAPVKPDADNIAKACLDGMKAHFRDEQVTELRVTKRYANTTETPRVEIRVWLVTSADEARAVIDRAEEPTQ